MNSFVSSPVAAPDSLRQVARWLAVAQQLKDTVTILLMNFLLLVPIAWPGLVLYALRWPLTRRHTEPDEGRVRWGLTLLHEVLCLWLFLSPDPDLNELRSFKYSYLLGTVLALASLGTTWLRHSLAPKVAPLP